ncbi:hypothetical protein Tco_1429489 [Tanacetum coccineum]
MPASPFPRVVCINLQEIWCSSSELECSSSTELEFPSSDELDSYSASSDDSDEYDSTGSLEKIVSHKGPSKDLQKWYKDEEEKDEEEDEKDEQEDETYDFDEEFWTPKSKGTSSKSLRTPKSKGTSRNSIPTTKKFVVKSSVPIRNCCIGLANKSTWEMIVNKTFGVQKEQVRKGSGYQQKEGSKPSQNDPKMSSIGMVKDCANQGQSPKNY